MFSRDRSLLCHYFSCKEVTWSTALIDIILRYSWRCATELVGPLQKCLCKGAKLIKN